MDQTLLAANARHILAAALDSEVGIQVKVMSPGLISPADRGRQVLYRFKNEDPRYANLQIKHNPDDTKTGLWIIKGDFVAHPDTTETQPSPPDFDLDIDL